MLERYLREIKTQKKPLLNLHSQVQFELPPTNFLSVIPHIEAPLVGSPLTLRYLGQYANMFDTRVRSLYPPRQPSLGY